MDSIETRMKSLAMSLGANLVGIKEKDIIHEIDS